MNVETYAALFARHPGVEPVAWVGGLLWGPSGVGKTRLAFARSLSVGATFVKAYRFVELARAVELDGDASAHARFRSIVGAAHLVLDDLATRRPSDFAYESLYRLLDQRWDARRETLVTSNVSPGALASTYDERVVSRICGFGPTKEITGGDRRLDAIATRFLRPKEGP